MDTLFEDTIKEMRALSASLRGRAHKVDAAIRIMLSAEGQLAQPVTNALAPTRGVALHTVEMMSFILEMGEAPLAAIRAYLETLGNGKDVTLRSQLSSFVAKGWLVRARRGYYRVTPLGAAKCGLQYEDRRG